MKFSIKNRWSGAVQFECELDASFESQAFGVQLGAAVKLAVKSRANLAGAYLAGANLARANLARANLARAYLARAYLARANLAGAYLAGANLARANLARANLARAYLARAYLAGANLAGANLADAYLAGANLAGAYLAGANLAGANLADAMWTDSLTLTMPPIQIAGCGYMATLINGTHIQLGCQLHTAEQWESLSDDAIRRFGGNPESWRKWKPHLLAILREMTADKAEPVIAEEAAQ